MTEPKLLTETEARCLWVLNRTQSEFFAALRERGLIAPEPPVDSLLIEAREIVARLNSNEFPMFAEDIQAGKEDDDLEVEIALAALKRGMELQRLAPAEPVDFDVEALARKAIADIRACSMEEAAIAAASATLARCARWPGVTELSDMAWKIAQGTPSVEGAALEMARRLRAYQTGAAS